MLAGYVEKRLQFEKDRVVYVREITIKNDQDHNRRGMLEDGKDIVMEDREILGREEDKERINDLLSDIHRMFDNNALLVSDGDLWITGTNWAHLDEN